MTIAIVSAIFGDYDHPKPPAIQAANCTYTLVTDQPCEVDGWDVVAVYDDRHPRVAAKEPKLRPWRYADGDAWIWVDGAFRIDSQTFAQEAIEATELLGQWRHPYRGCVYEEVLASAGLPKYTETPVVEQGAHYRVIGYPEHAGVWATGLIVYRQQFDYLADLWWAELNRFGYQDQISQPVALRNAGITPTDLPHSLWNNPWLSWHPHRSDQ